MFLKKLFNNIIPKIITKPKIHLIKEEDFNKAISKINIIPLTMVKKTDDQLTKELIDVVKEDIKNWNSNSDRYD